VPEIYPDKLEVVKRLKICTGGTTFGEVLKAVEILLGKL